MEYTILVKINESEYEDISYYKDLCIKSYVPLDKTFYDDGAYLCSLTVRYNKEDLQCMVNNMKVYTFNETLALFGIVNVNASDRIEFLRNYRPKDHHFTSNEEIKTLTSVLGMDGMNERGIQYTRDFVVQFYHMLKEDALERNGQKWTDESLGYSDAMMSVTAVIDHWKVNHGMEV